MTRSIATPMLLAVLGVSPALLAQDSPVLDEAAVGAFEWRCLGPANMSGRIVALAVNEQDPSTFWAATASGGLLKTTNNGITYEHQFDAEATVAIGDVCVAPSDPEIVWVGTGENNPRNSVSYGDGVYKSTDGGATWKNMGLRESFQIGRIAIHPTDPDVVYVGALGRLYGPNEERGLFKTTDGGESWEKVLYVDENTGVIDIAMHPSDPQTLLVATYERRRDGYDTNDPAVKIAPGSGLYLTTDGGATFERITEGLPTCNLGRIGLDWYRKDPNIVYAIVESEKIGQARDNVGWTGIEASNAETGARVVRIPESSPAAEAGLQKDDIVLSVNGTTVLSGGALRDQLLQHVVGADVKLEVAREGESHTIEFAMIAEPEEEEDQDEAPRRRRGGGPPYGASLGGQRHNVQDLQGPDGFERGGVYRSDDGGRSWQRINSVNPRPMYFSQIRVDPSDNNHLYVLGISAFRSVDGGETFTADASRGVHSDQHALWIDPEDGRHMILGTDGGLYVSYDRTANWDHHNHVALGQFYHVAVGPRRDYWIYGGLQDNGTWGAPHRAARGGGTRNEDWIRIGGGDGFLVAIDPEDPDQVYYESQNGGTARTHLRTMESGRIRPQAPRGTRYRFNWRTPFLLSHHNSRIYYNAGNHVFRSLNRGDDLVAISPEITRGDRGSATALAESSRDAGVLYVGTDDGALFGTRNGGADWTDLWVLAGDLTEDEEEAPEVAVGGPREVTATDGDEDGEPLGALVPAPRWVSSVEASRAVDGRVYLTLDAHRSDDDDPYVFVSENYGETWRSLRANLPRGSTRVVREDLENPDVLYLGTEFGLWVSLDRGGHWTQFHNNLPTVAVHEVAQHATSGEIVLGTHGRSLWAVDVTPLRQMSGKAMAADAHLFAPNDVVLWQRQHSRGTTGGARAYRADSADGGAAVYYRLAERARSVRLEVRDAMGKTVATLEAPRDAGLHRVGWNLRIAGSEPSGGGGRFRFSRGRRAEPGTYVVELEVDGETFSRPLQVVPHPDE